MILLRGSSQRARAHSFSPLQVKRTALHLHGRTVGHATPLNLEQFVSGLAIIYTEKCRFMDKRLCEISRFFVAPPRVFPLSVCARARESTYHFIQKYLQLSSS